MSLKGKNERIVSLPTSSIEIYQKTPDINSKATQNMAQSGISDSTESIKRYLENLFFKFPPASTDSVLFENYKYTNPQTVVNLKHNMGRPYRGMDVISVKCGVPFSLSLYQSSAQTIATGTTATLNLASSFDPYSSYNSISDAFTMPFSAYCILSASLLRSYSSGTITLSSDTFYLYNVTDSLQYSQAGIFSGVSIVPAEIIKCATLNQQRVFLKSNTVYSMRFTANSMTQTIQPPFGIDASNVYISETGNPEPRIDSVLDKSYSEQVKSVYIPIVCDRSCTFSAVVW